jgi:hypothetical protein
MANPLSNLALPPEAYRDLKVRLLLLGVFGASVALVWWSVNRLPAWEKKLNEQNRKITELEGEITQFELRWNGAEAERIAGRFKEAQEHVSAGPNEWTSWQGEMKRQANQFTVAFNPGATNTHDCPLPGKRFSILSATLDLSAFSPGTRTNSPYVRLLNFAQNLATQPKRVDLMELSASGQSNSVTEARMGVQLWSLENLP